MSRGFSDDREIASYNARACSEFFLSLISTTEKREAHVENPGDIL